MVYINKILNKIENS